MDFIAIDFETANYRSDSACQVGIAVVRNNQIVETISYLIKPPYGNFNPFFTQIHGISAVDVQHQAMFDGVWNIIEPYFADSNLIIAHNANFDMNVLFSTLKTFEIAIPELSVACTIAMARRTWVGEPSYALGALSKKFEIEFKHHDAGEDARACADIAIRVFDERGLANTILNADTVDEIAKRVGIKFGYIDERGFKGCRTISKAKTKKRGVLPQTPPL